MTGNNFQKTVLKEGAPALVEFWAPWCTYCRRIGPVMDQIAKQYSGALLVEQINIDEEPDLAQHFGVEVIPTLMYFQGGRPQASITAPESKAAIEAFLTAQGTAVP